MDINGGITVSQCGLSKIINILKFIKEEGWIGLLTKDIVTLISIKLQIVNSLVSFLHESLI